MSETVKVGRNRPPQNGWASKEEVAELRAEVAELRETNQKMLEEIKGLRAELGGAKRRHFLGAVATSAAAFFGKFFHRGEDLGDFHDKKEHSKGAKKGAHAKGEEKEKGGTPIISARRDEKSKNNSREQEDKRNKGKWPMWQKAAAVIATVAVAASAWAFANSPHKNAQDLPKDPSATEANAGDLHMPETEQALAEQAVEAAEAAHQQQLAETMGMSVEDMHAVADRHGVNHNDIGTVNAHDQMRDNLESDYNLSESFDLKDKSEAEQIEWGHKEVVFANMNNMYFTAEMMAARKQNMQAGTGDSFDVQVARELFAEYQRNPEAWKRDALDNNSVLKNSKTSIRQATSKQTFSVMTENKYDGNMKDCKTSENSGGESEYIVQEKLSEPDGESTVVDIKSGCGQMTWKVILRSQQPQVKERVVQQQGGKRRIYKEEQGERHDEGHEHEEGEETQPSDAKNEHADDPSERAQDDNQETPRSKVGSEMTHDKQQHNKDGSPIVDNNGNMNGTQGDDDSDRPGEVNQDQGSGGSGSGEHVTGGGATDTGSGNQGGPGEGGTGSNAGSGGSGGETSQDHQGGSSSWTRDRGYERSSSWKIGPDGKKVESSESSSYDTGRVEGSGDSNDAANGDVELQSVPIRQQD